MLFCRSHYSVCILRRADLARTSHTVLLFLVPYSLAIASSSLLLSIFDRSPQPRKTTKLKYDKPLLAVPYHQPPWQYSVSVPPPPVICTSASLMYINYVPPWAIGRVTQVAGAVHAGWHPTVTVSPSESIFSKPQCNIVILFNDTDEERNAKVMVSHYFHGVFQFPARFRLSLYDTKLKMDINWVWVYNAEKAKTSPS